MSRAGKPQKRALANKKKTSGVKWRLTPGERLWIGRIVLLVALTGSLVFACYAFDRFYFRKNPVFTVSDVERDVTIDATGSVMTRDVILEYLNIRTGMNIFDVMSSEQLNRLRNESPNIKDVQVEVRLPSKIHIKIVERDPIAEIPRRGRRLVVDEEGVVFTGRRSMGGLPQITGFEAEDLIEPGQRVPVYVLSALQLVQQLTRKDYSYRVIAIDTSDPGRFRLTFGDSRQANIAWAGMDQGDKSPSPEMIRRLDRLSRIYDVPYATGSVFDATTDRIAVTIE